MYLDFAWRYFRAKKSANAINIIAWVTVVVIAFATCCQVLVLSVFNGFEGLVKSLYASFYSDLRIVPDKAKTFRLSPEQISQIKKLPGIQAASLVVQEKALLKNDEAQTMVVVKGVDTAYSSVTDVAERIVNGKYYLGNADEAGVVVGIGIQSAVNMRTDSIFGTDNLTIISPKRTEAFSNSLDDLSEGQVVAGGSFAIQQDFDNQFAITNIDFLRMLLGYHSDEYSAMELKASKDANEKKLIKSIHEILGKGYKTETRYQQNSNLYATMQTEKWFIFAVLTLILIIAAFNMISALTMLVLEKKNDIGILQSFGTTRAGIRRIFVTEGLLLGGIGAFAGIALALIICFLQVKFKLIKLTGGTFLIDYFPVEVHIQDLFLVAGGAMLISLIAAWIPASRAAQQKLELK